MKKHAELQEEAVDNRATGDNRATDLPESSGNSESSEISETSENSENSETSEAAPDFQEQLRQAYLRGRNEAIEALMQRPGMMQPLHTPPPASAPGADAEIMILNNPRGSIWDK